ncbi:PRELI domain-containing protein 2-like [Branchiostoma floridae x Branchiostoma belcheri]
MVLGLDVFHVFKYPADKVIKTHLAKYPTPKEKFVECIKTVEEKVDSVSGIEYRKKLATCTNVVPNFLRRLGLLNVPAIYLEEESWYYRRQRTAKLSSRMLTWANLAELSEESEFRPSAENPNWTEFRMHGTIAITGVGPFGAILEYYAQMFLRGGGKKSIRIMEELLQERYGEGTKPSSNNSILSNTTSQSRHSVS